MEGLFIHYAFILLSEFFLGKKFFCMRKHIILKEFIGKFLCIFIKMLQNVFRNPIVYLLRRNIEFFDGVEEDILDMPAKIQARMIHLLELIEVHGANLGSPHTEPMGDGLFEIRAKAQEGIGRCLYCYMKGQHIIVLHAFVKKSQKTPKKDLQLARSRQREVERR